MTKTLLVRPPESYGASFAQFYTIHECLGIGYLAAYLRAHGYPVEILDAHVDGLSVEETIAEIKNKDFNVLGVSIGSSLVFPQAVQIIRKIKAWRGNVHITLGGQYPTFSYEQILNKHPDIDTVVRFEGEVTLLELVKKIDHPSEWKSIMGIAFRQDSQIMATLPRPLISDLDSLPFPARDTLPRLMERGGLPLISSSRGCHGRCSFCSVHSFYSMPRGKNWRARSLENVLHEIVILNKEFGCDELWFVDDNFLGFGVSGRKRARDLFVLLEKESVKLCGIDFSCRSDSIVKEPDLMDLAVKQGAGLVYLGVEAGVQRILNLYNKGTTVEQNKKAVRIIKDSGAEVKMEFIFFNPWITFDEVRETLSLLEAVNVYDPYILISALTIMKHTPMAEDIATGRLEVISPPPDELEKFDLDSFIPYQIQDQRTRALFQIASNTITQLEPALHATCNLHNILRMKRKVLQPDLAAKYEEIITNYHQLINETSLDIFKEAMLTVERMAIPVDTEQLIFYQKTMANKTLLFAAFLVNSIKIQEKELLEQLNGNSDQASMSR
ncbi:MAG: B12-binding domain-containing radical SAM protein [Deltaproteobacteria bacterium]|jgi:radical SAM superfamily enzyme YgiQ (UPF0313 family)|nr:B12-binding domain-containing radical SAM protein [Deltaproteobacteria bacterium]